MYCKNFHKRKNISLEELLKYVIRKIVKILYWKSKNIPFEY